jgi:hypothetical protein
LAAFCAQSRPSAFAEPCIGAGQHDLLDAELLAEHGQADAAVELEQAHDPVGQVARRADRLELSPQSARFATRLGAQQALEGGVELVEPGPQPIDDLARLHVGRGGAQQVGDMELEADRGLLEQGEPDLFGHVPPRRGPPTRPACRTGARRR